jgi:predicted component of type VI protein secretion system
MRRIQRLGAFAVLLCLAAGCASSRVDVRGQSTTTAVTLTGKNYRLIKPGAKGQSYGFKLLGIIPLASPNAASARQSLYGSVTEPLAGKAIAIANQMEDRSTLYLILFSVPKLTLTADVIEFTDKTEK